MSFQSGNDSNEFDDDIRPTENVHTTDRGNRGTATTLSSNGADAGDARAGPGLDDDGADESAAFNIETTARGGRVFTTGSYGHASDSYALGSDTIPSARGTSERTDTDVPPLGDLDREDDGIGGFGSTRRGAKGDDEDNDFDPNVRSRRPGFGEFDNSNR